jgi:hypothetical protein
MVASAEATGAVVGGGFETGGAKREADANARRAEAADQRRDTRTNILKK